MVISTKNCKYRLKYRGYPQEIVNIHGESWDIYNFSGSFVVFYARLNLSKSSKIKYFQDKLLNIIKNINLKSNGYYAKTRS